tara:strand:+ start:576 stop:740 length:165 start_codon:yes stop_codon:yes gene_type:complete
MDHHQELYEWNQQFEEAEHHQWELEQQEQEENKKEQKRNEELDKLVLPDHACLR